MADQIQDGTGANYRARVTSDNRVTVDAITELVSSERSRTGNLFGVGTGYVTTSGAMNFGGVLWLRNDAVGEDLYVQKLICGWNGGSTSFNRTARMFIKYQTSAPTGNETEIDDQVENIGRAGSSAVKSDKVTAYKWDGVGNGFTGGSGGFLQIPNQVAQGNTSISIDGEIILGPGDSMELQVIDDGSDQEAGVLNAAIVYYFAPAVDGRSGI